MGHDLEMRNRFISEIPRRLIVYTYWKDAKVTPAPERATESLAFVRGRPNQTQLPLVLQAQHPPEADSSSLPRKPKDMQVLASKWLRQTCNNV
jgi:hypothetical protein